MPYTTSEVYGAAKKQRFHLIYQTQAVAAAEVVTIQINQSCNLINISTTAGTGTIRLKKQDGTTMFDTTVIPNRDAIVIVGTGTNILEITNSTISTIGVSQMAVWGDFT